MSALTRNRIAQRLDQLGEYRRFAERVRRQTGKSLAQQVREIWDLKHLGGQCGISDYYWYRLYDPAYQCGRGAADYLGWRLQQEFSLALNPRIAALPGVDKIAFYSLAAAAGLPLAPVLATYHPGEGLVPQLGMHLRDVRAVERLLRDPSIYPIFVKPSFSQQGYGSHGLVGFEPKGELLHTFSGGTLPLAELLRSLTHSVDRQYHKPECGCLFQPMLKPAAEIVAFNEWPAVCGARVVCLNGPEGVQPIRAIWKIAVRPNHVDNFSLGKHGNLVADIDLDSGEVRRMVNGMGPDAGVLDTHPQTGKPLAGFRLPGWQQVLQACKAAGAVFPLLQVQHWDVAFTEQGPFILELNDLGATEFLQLHGHGLLTPATRAFLKADADRQAQSWVAGL